MLTSQGVAVSHSQLPWMEIGCVRCHYDVADPPTSVAPSRCRQCHSDLADLNRRAVGRDLHPIHDGLTCTTCHEKRTHEVKAMSSAVDLVCSDCHLEVHGFDLKEGRWPESGTCAACHQRVHASQQRLLLGITPASGPAAPSAHFMAGLTCRSCHVPDEAAQGQPTTPIRGRASACTGCHPRQYARVLDWWREGLRTRFDRTRAYLDTAEPQLVGVPDTARDLFGEAEAMVSLIRWGGGEHNLELSDRLMREAVDRAQRAYRVAGRTPPPPPDLGRVPHAGLCSYCHYRSTEPRNFGRMPADFHQSVLGAGR